MRDACQVTGKKKEGKNRETDVSKGWPWGRVRFRRPPRWAKAA